MPLFVRARLRIATFVVVVLALGACESTLSIQQNNQTWGFLQTGALEITSGVYATLPNGQFFRGTVTSIPDARVKPDSCVELQLTTQNPLQVTFLDAGSFITTQFGARVDTIPRVTSVSRTTYEVTTARPYRPGDSLIVRVPGVAGGFPAAEIRAKTAEAFTFDTLGIRPSPPRCSCAGPRPPIRTVQCWPSSDIPRLARQRPTWSSAARLWTTVPTR